MTKKMTKAEAFEYLKGKKVYVNGKSNLIQLVLFRAGFSWGKTVPNETRAVESPFLYTTDDGFLKNGESMIQYACDTNEEISADDILSIEIIEEEKPTTTKGWEYDKHIKAIQEMVKRAKVACVIISKNDIGVLKE